MYSIYMYTCVKVIRIRIFSWYVFFCIQALYRNLPYKSLYSVQIRENNADQKKLLFYLDIFQAIYIEYT